HRRIAILELLQKHIRQRDLMLLLEQLVTLIDEGYTSGSQLVAMQNYMLQRGHTEQADLFYGVLRDRETGGESMMTLAQWFAARGRPEVSQAVRQEVIQEVSQEVRQEFALRFLSTGLSRDDVAALANFPRAEVDKLIS
ncbi:Rpn family recombination-promoting nuclease/putative transposase, partial [Escherichia coli]|nr:Rpn family recombination-promoting nuclease/putative transposase [Escherichia coli]